MTMMKRHFAFCLAGAFCALAAPVLAKGQGFSLLNTLPSTEPGMVAIPLQANDGNLYFESNYNGLTFYRMPLGGGPLTTVASVTDYSQGSRIVSAPIQGRDGNLYGVTVGGGAYGRGVVYRLTLTGAYTVLYNFTGGADGKYPLGGLIQASDGNLYGTTSEDDTTESMVPAGYPPLAGGTVWEITPASGGAFTAVGPGGSTFSTLYTFSNNWYYGVSVSAPLIEGADHNIYGVSYNGGDQTFAPSTYGFIYGFPLGGASFNILHEFTAYDGAGPLSIMQASDGNLYGGCWLSFGGSGSIWQYQIGTGSLTTLYQFPAIGNQISYPTHLVQGPDGLLYGAATFGTADPTVSTLFSMPVGGTSITPLYTFTGGADGANCYEGVMFGTDGNLYGDTLNGGANGTGTIWEYSFRPDIPTVTAHSNTNTLWPPNGKSVPVTVSGTITDPVSIVGSAVTYSVVDSEGQVQPSGSATVHANGSYSFTVSLVASRKGTDKSGRTYTITVTGANATGHSTTATVVVTVPHNQ